MQPQDQAELEASSCYAEASSLMVTIAAYPKILQWSVGKITDSRRRRTGIDLRRNLLIANVIFKARTGILQFRARLEEKSRMAQATSDASAAISDTATGPDTSAAITTSDISAATSDTIAATSDTIAAMSDVIAATSDTIAATSDTIAATSDSSSAMWNTSSTSYTSATASDIPATASDTSAPSFDACATSVTPLGVPETQVPVAPRKRRSKLFLPESPNSFDEQQQQQQSADGDPASPHSPPKRAMIDESDPEYLQEESEEQHQHQHKHQQLLVLQSSFLDLSVGSQASQAQTHIPCLICSS